MAKTDPPKTPARPGSGGNTASPEAAPPAVSPWTADERAGALPLPMPDGEGAVPAPAPAAAPPAVAGGAAHVGSGRSVPGGPPEK